ncbi:SPOR domain-containing protein [Pokkaliibacter sp. MBI-7]|uniref:SPOR domain-containing protein n=1 Tax=Pokkaliibacter sp. MBI-7 TaxID=3040600 RepID=UPI00244A0463|nr:SPOR domain-containing protein [Pokkaliibacter sp. MBI-7]MDH2433604.1 SPOR domain-containing protein [Pokkaliibacter sp. MBI-7]
MATQDFAKSQSRARSGSSSRKKAPAKKSGFSWRIASVLVLVGVFGFILVQLARVKTDPAATQAALAVKPAPEEKEKPKAKVKAPPPAQAPDSASKSWDFYKLLPESEVPLPPDVQPLATQPPPPPKPEEAKPSSSAELAKATEAVKLEAAKTEAPKVVDKSTATAAPAAGRFLLQVGAFKTEDEAEKMRVKMFLQGFQEVGVSPGPDSKGQTWWRVRLGPFSGDGLSKAEGKLSAMGSSPIRVPVR